MTSADSPFNPQTAPTSWQLTAAAYSALSVNRWAAFRFSAVPLAALIAISLVLDRSAAAVRGPFDAFILLSFFAGSHVLITLVVFTRWTGLLLGYRDRALPLTRLRELARPWLLASIIWCVVFLVVMELAIRALAGSIALRGEATGPDWQTDLQIFVELNPMLVAIPAWMLASFAAAARFLQSSARVADLRAERLSMILRASPQAARAYAIAPLPAILSTYAILAIAEPIGPEWWSTFTWGAYGPLNTIVATLLIGGIGVGAIQASTTVAGD